MDYSICKDIKTETLSTGRTYFTPVGKFPSITTVLGATANNQWLEAWRERVGIEEANRISKEATDRGEAVHSYFERFFNDEDINIELLADKEHFDIIGMTTRLIKAGQKNITKIWAQEIAVWDKLIGCAGRLDCVGEWRGEPAIIDLKTSKKKKYISQIKDYYIQTAFYAEAHNQMFNTNINKLVILITIENGTVQAFYGSRIHYIPNLKYRINQYKKLKGLK